MFGRNAGAELYGSLREHTHAFMKMDIEVHPDEYAIGGKTILTDHHGREYVDQNGVTQTEAFMRMIARPGEWAILACIVGMVRFLASVGHHVVLMVVQKAQRTALDEHGNVDPIAPIATIHEHWQSDVHADEAREGSKIAMINFVGNSHYEALVNNDGSSVMLPPLALATPPTGKLTFIYFFC